MTNKERYKKAYENIRPHDDFKVDLEKTPVISIATPKNVLAVMMAGVLLFGGAGSAYAKDFCGIRSKLETIIRGGYKVQATIEVNDDQTYTVHAGTESYTGVVSGEKMSKEDILQDVIAELEDPQMVVENGRAIIWWKDQEDDVTDKFEDGICYHEMTSNGETIQVTILAVDNEEYPYYYSVSRTGKFVDPQTMPAWKKRHR